MWSKRISGCGLVRSVDVVWMKMVCVLETTIGCSTAGITRYSWKGTVGVVWRGSLVVVSKGLVGVAMRGPCSRCGIEGISGCG